MKVINLIGEAGVGKTTTAAGIFHNLSIKGYKSEYVPEIVKGYAWETPKDSNGKSLVHPIFKQQVYILGEQNRHLERLREHRDVAIVESPLILTAIYKPDNYLDSFENIVLEMFNTYDNVNIVLERTHNYDTNGRVQTEEESKTIRKLLLNYLDRNNIEYVLFKTHKKISKEITKYIIKNHLS